MHHSRDVRLVGHHAPHPGPDLEQAVRPEHEDGLPVQLHVQLPHGHRDEPPGGRVLAERVRTAGPEPTREEGGLLADLDAVPDVPCARGYVGT